VRFPTADDPASAAAWGDRVLDALAGSSPPPALSSVSRRAIDLLQAQVDGTPRVGEIAARLGLSATRLTHVFSKEVGIPFRRFVLWTRIKRATEAVQRGADLTAAAFAAGFSDAAHLSRTFREMFGLSPSLLLLKVELIGDVRGDRFVLRAS
jgi:AraC-like DNA-binding protein